MDLRWTIIGSAALIAAAIALGGHYQIGVAPGQVYRVDRWTGAVVACNVPVGTVGNVQMFQGGYEVPCRR